jgi:hypothetical protein
VNQWIAWSAVIKTIDAGIEYFRSIRRQRWSWTPRWERIRWKSRDNVNEPKWCKYDDSLCKCDDTLFVRIIFKISKFSTCPKNPVGVVEKILFLGRSDWGEDGNSNQFSKLSSQIWTSATCRNNSHEPCALYACISRFLFLRSAPKWYFEVPLFSIQNYKKRSKKTGTS